MPSTSSDIDSGRISMDLLRAISPSVSTSSSLDSNGLPHGRIQCNRSQILVGTQKYESATDALVAYLNQFDLNEGPSPVISLPNSDSDWKKSTGHTLGGEINEKNCDRVLVNDQRIIGSGLVMGPNGLGLNDNKEDVEKLLTSKVSPELKEEVTDTLREVKLRHLLKKAAIKSQKQTKTGLQQEVEAALARSAKLLEKVTREEIASTRAGVSDLSDVSISTQALLAGNSGSSDESILSVESLELKEKKTGHIYSHYQPPLKISQPPTSSPFPHNSQRHSRQRTRRGSIDSLLPPPHNLMNSQIKVSPNCSSNSLSNNSDPSDIIRRIRSRSVPPRLHKEQQSQSTEPNWLSELDCSVRKSVPSWVKSMSPSEVSDYIWLQSGSPKKSAIPSWVEDVNKSEISMDVSALESFPGNSMMSSPSRPILASKFSSSHQMREDLEYIANESIPKNTHTSPILSPSHASAKHVTFGDSETHPGSVKPIHSTPISRNAQRTGEKYSIRKLTSSKVLDSEFNGEAYLRKNILPQTARLKKSMENFAISSENLRKSPSSSCSDASSDPKCSSLDTFALLTGKTLWKGDVPTEKSIGNAIFPDSLAISSILPEGSQGRLSNGHSSSDGLDGDRPWEAMTNTFKPPVPVGRDGEGLGVNGSGLDAAVHKHLSTSLSGGNQPGSMEALKNMLFKLQAEENSVQGTKSISNTETTNLPQSPSSPAVIPALQDYDFQMEPGGHSLEKALLHLNRLKTLVKNTPMSSKCTTDASTTEGNTQENNPLETDTKGMAS